MSVVLPTASFPNQKAYIARNAFDSEFVRLFIQPGDQFSVLRFFQWFMGRDYILVPKSSKEKAESYYHIDAHSGDENFIMWIAMKNTHANHFVDAEHCGFRREYSQGDGYVMFPGDFSVHTASATCHADPREGYENSMGFLFIPRHKNATMKSFMKTYRKFLREKSKVFLKL